MGSEKEIMAFCENVRYLRKKNGLSKKEMAKKLGIGVKSLELIETGSLP
jgi:transcriptional regulator with XRE-family HTH domain